MGRKAERRVRARHGRAVAVGGREVMAKQEFGAEIAALLVVGCVVGIGSGLARMNADRQSPFQDHLHFLVEHARVALHHAAQVDAQMHQTV